MHQKQETNMAKQHFFEYRWDPLKRNTAVFTPIPGRGVIAIQHQNYVR